jgi:hypothetical protein
MTITTLALIVTATVATTIALPAAAHAAGADYYMQSPSGRIVCDFGYYANLGGATRCPVPGDP